jgi:hypothetical protein
VVERHLAKVHVARSTRVTRLKEKHFFKLLNSFTTKKKYVLPIRYISFEGNSLSFTQTLFCENLTKKKLKESRMTGFEPATSAVTGRCSEPLNYIPFLWT